MLRPAVEELIRQTAERALSRSEVWIDELNQAVFSATDLQPFADDPDVRALFLRDIQIHVAHWAAAQMERPGQRVTAPDEPVDTVAQTLLYRGLSEASLDAYRLAQNVAWRRWMSIAFELTTDVDDIKDMLDITSASISAFVDESIATLTARIAIEREVLHQGRDATRLEAISRVLTSDAIKVSATEQTLGYRLGQRHTAIVVWTTDPSPKLSELEQAVAEIARHVGARSFLRTVASAGTVWAWLGDADTGQLSSVESVIRDGRPWQVAIGSTGAGVDGFRTAHLDAVSTQRMLARLGSTRPVAAFNDVEGVLLLTDSPDRADRFVESTLGQLSGDYPDLRDSLRIYLRELCNVSAAAEQVLTHRNTMLRRIKRANELLPRPLEENAPNVTMALEICHWRGASKQAHR